MCRLPCAQDADARSGLLLRKVPAAFPTQGLRRHSRRRAPEHRVEAPSRCRRSADGPRWIMGIVESHDSPEPRRRLRQIVPPTMISAGTSRAKTEPTSHGADPGRGHGHQVPPKIDVAASSAGDAVMTGTAAPRIHAETTASAGSRRSRARPLGARPAHRARWPMVWQNVSAARGRRVVIPEQAGAGHVADQRRPAGQQQRSLVAHRAVVDEKTDVLEGVAGRVGHGHGDVAELQRLSVLDGPMIVGVTRSRAKHLRSCRAASSDSGWSCWKNTPQRRCFVAPLLVPGRAPIRVRPTRATAPPRICVKT